MLGYQVDEKERSEKKIADSRTTARRSAGLVYYFEGPRLKRGETAEISGKE